MAASKLAIIASPGAPLVMLISRTGTLERFAL
jgi:hypothetical protein